MTEHLKHRETAIRIHGENYPEVIVPYQAIIEYHRKLKCMGVLPAAVHICSFEPVKSMPAMVMMFMAAAAETINQVNSN